MPITPLPTPAPSRADPANFAARGDAFLGALPTFAIEAEQARVEVNENAAAALASQNAATAATGVIAWVSGTTYAVGTVRFDTTNFLSYRRTTAGAGTTRPGLDGVNWVQVSGTGNVTLNGGPLSGFRNLIINGNFAINQRVYVSGTAVGAANTYTLDRWRVVTSGQGLNFSASGNGNQITAPAGGVEQVIEGASIAGGAYIINWTGTASATVNGTARIKGESFTLTANTNATVRFSSGTVSVVQLEPGSVATVFENRPIGIELDLCQRYCIVFPPQSFRTAGYGGTSGSILTVFPLPSAMRATPTLTNPGSFNAVNLTGFTFTAANQSTVRIGGTVVSIGTYSYEDSGTPAIASAEF